MEKSKKSINVEGGFLFCGGWNFSKSVSVGPTFIREMRVVAYSIVDDPKSKQGCGILECIFLVLNSPHCAGQLLAHENVSIPKWALFSSFCPKKIVCGFAR